MPNTMSRADLEIRCVMAWREQEKKGPDEVPNEAELKSVVKECKDLIRWQIVGGLARRQKVVDHAIEVAQKILYKEIDFFADARRRRAYFRGQIQERLTQIHPS